MFFSGESFLVSNSNIDSLQAACFSVYHITFVFIKLNKSRTLKLLIKFKEISALSYLIFILNFVDFFIYFFFYLCLTYFDQFILILTDLDRFGQI